MHSDSGRIFVSYSYFEKDDIQKANFEFFLLAAMGVNSISGQDTQADYYLVINGDVCTPCEALQPMLEQDDATMAGVAWIKSAPGITMLKRIANEGMDFAAHNTSMTYAMRQSLWRYRFFMFLNSSVKGPFLPKYYPQELHWSVPFSSRITERVKAVSSSLVCLPSVDAGGPGPKIESWAFGTDVVGLRTIIARGVFHERTCKLCTDGIVVMGEYGLTTALFEQNLSVDTLMAMYANVDWHDPANWNCNDQVHPSRHGTYDGISMHPYEVIFLKASWHVGEPFADKYAAWKAKQLRGLPTTNGHFDKFMYNYAIQPEAQDKPAFIERAYAVGPNVERLGLTGFQALTHS